MRFRPAMFLVAVLLIISLASSGASCIIQKATTELKVSESYDPDTQQLIVYAKLTYTDLESGKSVPLAQRELLYTVNYTTESEQKVETAKAYTDNSGKAKQNFVITGAKSHSIEVVFKGDGAFKESRGTLEGEKGGGGVSFEANLPPGIDLITCMPLLLLLGFLGAAMYASGRNPFGAVDFTAPRGIAVQRRMMKAYQAGWFSAIAATAGSLLSAVGAISVREKTQEEKEKEIRKKEEEKAKESEKQKAKEEGKAKMVIPQTVPHKQEVQKKRTLATLTKAGQQQEKGPPGTQAALAGAGPQQKKAPLEEGIGELPVPKAESRLGNWLDFFGSILSMAGGRYYAFGQKLRWESGGPKTDLIARREAQVIKMAGERIIAEKGFIEKNGNGIVLIYDEKIGQIRYESLKDQKQKLEEKKKELQEQNKALENTKQKIQIKKVEITNKLENDKSALRASEKKYDEKLRELGDLKKELKRLEEASKDEKARIPELKAKIDAVQKETAKLGTDIKSLNTNIAKLEGALKTVKNREEQTDKQLKNNNDSLRQADNGLKALDDLFEKNKKVYANAASKLEKYEANFEKIGYKKNGEISPQMLDKLMKEEQKNVEPIKDIRADIVNANAETAKISSAAFITIEMIKVNIATSKQVTGYNQYVIDSDPAKNPTALVNSDAYDKAKRYKKGLDDYAELRRAISDKILEEKSLNSDKILEEKLSKLSKLSLNIAIVKAIEYFGRDSSQVEALTKISENYSKEKISASEVIDKVRNFIKEEFGESSTGVGALVKPTVLDSMKKNFVEAATIAGVSTGNIDKAIQDVLNNPAIKSEYQRADWYINQNVREVEIGGKTYGMKEMCDAAQRMGGNISPMLAIAIENADKIPEFANSLKKDNPNIDIIRNGLGLPETAKTEEILAKLRAQSYNTQEFAKELQKNPELMTALNETFRPAVQELALSTDRGRSVVAESFGLGPNASKEEILKKAMEFDEHIKLMITAQKPKTYNEIIEESSRRDFGMFYRNMPASFDAAVDALEKKGKKTIEDKYPEKMIEYFKAKENYEKAKENYEIVKLLNEGNKDGEIIKKAEEALNNAENNLDLALQQVAKGKTEKEKIKKEADEKYTEWSEEITSLRRRYADIDNIDIENIKKELKNKNQTFEVDGKIITGDDVLEDIDANKTAQSALRSSMGMEIALYWEKRKAPKDKPAEEKLEKP